MSWETPQYFIKSLTAEIPTLSSVESSSLPSSAQFSPTQDENYYIELKTTPPSKLQVIYSKLMLQIKNKELQKHVKTVIKNKK